MLNIPVYDFLDFVQSPVFVLGSNDASEVVYTCINQSACDLFGVTKDDIVGKSAMHVFDKGYGKPVYGRHVMAMCTGQPIAYEVNVAVGGRPLLLHTQLMPLRNSDGEVVNVVGTTQEMSVECALRESQSHTQTMLKEAEQFIALAAHDLRAPIRNFTSLVTLLADSINELDAEQRSLLGLVQNLADKSYNNIDDIVSYAAATTVNQYFDEYNLAAVGTAVLESLDPLSHHTAKFEDRWIFGDKISSELIIKTLFSQAIKNNPNKRLTLRLHVEPTSDTRYKIVYTDNGVGYDPIEISHQGDSEFILKSGYGLSSIRRIINEREGELHIGNLIDSGGRRASFTLPGHVLFFPERMVG
ncbi:MAG: PAS domain-containing protein [Pseudomonadota bacterium]